MVLPGDRRGNRQAHGHAAKVENSIFHFAPPDNGGKQYQRGADDGRAVDQGIKRRKFFYVKYEIVPVLRCQCSLVGSTIR